MKTPLRRTSSAFKSTAEALPIAIAIATAGQALSSGMYGPPARWLEDGGRRSLGVPEFFWDLELRRIAAEVVKKEEILHYKPALSNDADTNSSPSAMTATAVADSADFADAIKSGRLSVPDPSASQASHDAMRKWLDARHSSPKQPDAPPAESSPSDALSSDPLSSRPPVPNPPPSTPQPPGGPPGEFADYHAGCLAPDAAGAIAAWKILLDRPAAERHYRSVWASFMIGKKHLEASDWPAAIAAFQLCRSLAREGFADSLGLAADSVGWEAYAELAQRHYPAAARLYLRQLAQGDSSAIVSLRAVVPDTVAGVPGAEFHHLADPANEDEATAARWLDAAHDPVLRQVATAHVLATETDQWRPPGESQRCLRWLQALEGAKIEKLNDAAPLGWTAYTAGRYDEAARWLAMESNPTPLGQWLRAKLALRAGRFAEATRLMPSVIAGLPPDEGLREPNLTYLPSAIAHADLAAAHHAAGRFTRALEEWYLGHSESDCAHLAERLLTTTELGAFISKNMPKAPEPTWEEEDTSVWPLERIQIRLRSIYGRRLVREGRAGEAKPFLTPEARSALEAYLAAMARATNKKKPAIERARAWFDAALIMQRDGPEFRGTIEEFNTENFGGTGHQDPLVAERVTGRITRRSWDGSGDSPQVTTEPAVLAPGKEERRRLAATSSQRAIANRTPLLAAGLAKKAAALLPDNTEELADVLNSAGDWIEDIDNTAADRLYYQLESRCPLTTIGKAAIAKHWFTRQPGPWSQLPPE